MFSLQKLKRVDYPTAVALRIRRRLATSVGSYELMIKDTTGLFVLDSDYGSYLPTYVSKPNSTELLDQIKKTVQTSLVDEPISIKNVDVVRSNQSKVDITIRYTLKDYSGDKESSLVFSL